MEQYTRLLKSLREQDYDRYLVATLLPESQRPLWVVLSCLRYELAKISAIASDPMMGCIRLKWWQEAIEKSRTGNSERHDIIELLNSSHQKTPFSIAPITEGMVLGREVEFHDTPFAGMDDLCIYAEATTSSLYYVMLEAMRVDKASDAYKLAKLLGETEVLLEIVRSLPHRAKMGRVLLPKDTLDRYGITSSDVLARKEPEKISAATSALLYHAQNNIKEMLVIRKTTPKEVRILFRNINIQQLYVNKMCKNGERKINFDVDIMSLKKVISVIF